MAMACSQQAMATFGASVTKGLSVLEMEAGHAFAENLENGGVDPDIRGNSAGDGSDSSSIVRGLSVCGMFASVCPNHEGDVVFVNGSGHFWGGKRIKRRLAL